MTPRSGANTIRATARQEGFLISGRFRFKAWALVGAAMLCAAAAWTPSRVAAQRGGLFLGSADDPGIQYSTAPLDNIVDDLNRTLEAGSARLVFEGRSGYLRSAIDALKLPIDSQLLVYSKGSLQGRLVEPTNPRALFFSDRVALGWVRDAELLEVAALDRRAGVVFYSLEQRPSERPAFKREFRCLGCHLTGDTLGIPGLLMFSSTPETSNGGGVKVVATDHRTPYAERFGGWFVTGNRSLARHRGNQVAPLDDRSRGGLTSVAGLFDPDGFRGATSDIAALLTFSHQAQMTNLLTRASWEARAADPALHPGASIQLQAVDTLMNGVAEEVVDYMLFVDEPPLPNGVSGRSGFSERMSTSVPRDRNGRSLYELDLNRRLMKYPCSFLIYSPAFDALPPLVKTPIYRRMWQVLSGDANGARYRALTLEDRQAIVEILRDTKSDLPAYFTTPRQ
ncbi:MAG TPA: hypothetical protein VM032_06110 [Vicinamibacterales bacterium]|nr:hypothetical protein [Vicinamibacterales bacterium]